MILDNLKSLLNEELDSSDFSDIEIAVHNLWESFEKMSMLTKARLKEAGQGGAIGAFEKEYLMPLNEAIDKLDRITDDGIFKV